MRGLRKAYPKRTATRQRIAPTVYIDACMGESVESHMAGARISLAHRLKQWNLAVGGKYERSAGFLNSTTRPRRKARDDRGRAPNWRLSIEPLV
ncbi:hypothetical protein SPHINGO391_500089 [Sphingomonas aurantiaca]|uniref:Uncharacterized protein n=1 Tax=Sphingomonas aurantiaca TaxID=185949 RepID=A0A5E8A8W9_9SPHN|nr:hypothetical protein SPHINGO391_500089 [Sphingomonas aurantiaca]